MRFELDDDRRARLIGELRDLFREEFDEELSAFRAERLLAFLVARLGPPIYNQAIQDARGFLQERLDDLDAEFYEPDPDVRPRAD
jgi:uncharacterized protein (DUF2164 family)